MTFSEHLYQLRVVRRLSQKDVAQEIGVALQTYQRYEYGNREPTLSTLIAIADFYDLSLDELVCRERGASDSTGSKLRCVSSIEDSVQ